MDRVNGIVIEVIFEKRGHSPGADRLRKKRNKILEAEQDPWEKAVR